MCCFSGIIRPIMFVFNFACLVVGITLIAVGSVFYISVNQYDKLIKETSGFNVVPSLIIAVGVIVFVISFLGCCGAIKNSSRLLTAYAILLIALLIVQFVGGVYGVVLSKKDDNSLRDDVVKHLDDAFTKYDDDKIVKDIFQSIQSTVKCCGVYGPYDYKEVLKWDPKTLAGGCCGKPNDDECYTNQSLNYEDGCGRKFYEVLISAIRVVSIVALSICGIELLGAVAAICLVRSK